MDVNEAERLVRGLKVLGVQDVGRSWWLRQHRVIERLSNVAHSCARTNSDDYVLSAFLTFEQLPTLVSELLAAEAWRERVFPTVMEHASVHCSKGGSGNSMRAYFALHNEAVIANLLECFLYHEHAAAALGDALIDLIDWCVRRATHLASLTFERQRRAGSGAAAAVDNARVLPDDVWEEASRAAAPADSASAAALLAAEAADPSGTARSQLRRWRGKSVLGLGVTAVAMLRYISDYAAKLSLSTAARLMDTHDVALLMVPLLENPPWVRRSGPNAWQKYVDHNWVDVAPNDLLKITPCEGQPWLTLHALLLEPDLRRRYALSSHRRGTLARIRRFLNEVLLDQLPLLADLQRFLDELAVTGTDPGADQEHGKLLLEAVPEFTQNVEVAALLAPVGWVGNGQLRAGVSGAGKDAGERVLSASSILRLDGGASASLAMRVKWSWEDLAAHACVSNFRLRAPRTSRSSAGDAGSDGDADLAALGAELTEGIWDDDSALGAPKCAKCGEPATKRCSKCHNEWYCSRECQVAAWKGHKEVCAIVSRDNASN